MQHIQFKPMQCIKLRERGAATPSQALNEAISFVDAHGLKEAELDYHGYTFLIEPGSDIRTKLADYQHYRNIKDSTKTVKATVGGIEFNMSHERAQKVLRLQKLLRRGE